MSSCPRCNQPMQAFTLRGLELDRCRDCGRVWLDLNEVERVFGDVETTFTETEVDQGCPRGHGPMVNGKLKEQPAVICSHCRGAWVIDTLSPAPEPAPPVVAAAPAKPRPAAPKAAEIIVKCQACGRLTPLSQAVQLSRGTCCRECELSAATYVTPSSTSTEDKVAAGLQVAEIVVELLVAILR